MLKKVYKIKGMHCTSCALMIESDLEDAGYKANCSYAKQILEVEGNTSEIEDSRIVEIVNNAGYQIDLPTTNNTRQ